jgi:hypothetical protein
MGKWNFDVIFEGSTDEQADKAGDFLAGARRRAEKLELEFTEAILGYGRRTAGDVRAEIKENISAAEAFSADPRALALVEKAKEVKKAAVRERYGKPAHQAAENVLDELLR